MGFVVLGGYTWSENIGHFNPGYGMHVRSSLAGAFITFSNGLSDPSECFPLYTQLRSLGLGKISRVNSDILIALI